jgi:hypothetical protein
MKKYLLWFVCCLAIKTFAGDPKKKDAAPANDESNSSFEYQKETNTLTIRFFEEEMMKTQPEVVAYMRSHSDYVFDAPFSLPEELWKALGSSQPLVIEKGKYPLSFRKGVFSVYVQFDCNDAE